MARHRSERVEKLKSFLIARVRYHAPGDRLPSARAIASLHRISYQTAHRLLEELANEGYVERRVGSGTYIPGEPVAGPAALRGATILMSPRARRPSSFGARLLAGLAEQLRRAAIPWQLQWADALTDLGDELIGDTFPVLWEAPTAVEHCRRASRRALILNDRPAPGLDSTLLDSVSIDDYFGGCCAADMLLRKADKAASFAVVSGPADSRSDERVAGFLSRLPNASVVPAGGWYVENGMAVAENALRAGTAGIFCVNDRLAQAIATRAADLGFLCPPLIGFDNAPVAAELNLTTIAIPWSEMAADAAQIIDRRINNDTSAARRRLITPQPVLRNL